MKTSKVILIALFFVCTELQAQNAFISGYILSKESDTIRGLVNDQNWRENPREIIFKAGVNEEDEVFTASDIKGFGIWNEIEEHYRAVNMEIDFSPIKTNDLSYNKERKLVRISVFLRVRILGPINLYELKDTIQKEHFFVQKGNGKIAELVYHRFLDDDAIQTAAYKSNNRYQDQLYEMMIDCEGISLSDTRKLEYRLFNINRIIQNYNECVAPEQYQYVSKKEKPKFKFGFVGGTSYSFVNFGPGVPAGLSSIQYDFSLGYLVGLGLDIQLSRNLGRNSIRIESIIHSRRYKAQWSGIDNSSFSKSMLQTNYIYQYKKINRKVNPHLGAGLSIYLSSEKNNQISPNEIKRTVQYIVSNKVGKIGIAGIVNSGLEYRNVYLDFRYYYFLNSNIVFLESSASVYEQSFQVSFSWFFN